ncbi:MAG: SMC family ATPase [Thermoplasmata archaeon]|nr:SMC family ATPase [Thermoplasmata archaeon]
MRLRTIQLLNYRRFKLAELELPDGMVSIIGPNGSGKSTLMEAVAWALFGNQSEIVRTGKESIKRQGANHTEPCMARIEFDFEDTGYIVERTMKGKNLTMNASMYAGDNLMARGTEEVSQALMKLFGMDHKSFFISVFARQKELNALTSQPKGERKRMVLRLLDIENIDEAIKHIREDARYAKDAIQSARDELTTDDGGSVVKELKKKLVGLETQKKELAKSHKCLEYELKNIESVHKKLKKELDSLDKLAREKEKLELTKKALEAKLSILKEQKEELAADLKQLEVLETQYNEIQPKASKIKSDLESVLDKQKLARSQEQKLVVQVTEHKAGIKHLAREIDKIKTSMSEIENMGPESDCPTCERKLGDTYQKLLDAFESQINDRKKQSQVFSTRLSDMEKEQEGSKALFQALAKREERLRQRLKDFDILQAKVERGSKLRKRQDSLEEKLLDSKCQLKDVKTKLDGIKFDQKSFDKAKAAYEEMNIDLRTIDRQKMKLDSEIARLEERQKARTGELARLEKVQKKYDKKKAEAEILTALETVIGEFRKHLISRIRPALASMSSELLSVLTEGRYNEIELSEDYDISIRDAGDMHKLDRFSGGEKDLANLCLRLAISEIIATRHGTNSFDMIVLDEIFGSLDANRKRALLTTLNGLSNRFKQIFLITHVEDVKELMGNVIQVSEGSDGTSRAEVIQ